jgi:glycosyltransferase involved in cell wall biosynthesis
MGAKLEPLVSVGIVTYNQEKFIADCIDSVINQTYEHITIAIADDASSDATPSIVREYANRYSNIKAVLAAENKGIAHNINRALQSLEGDYLVILDGDDLMYPTKVEQQVNYLEENADVIACAHEVDVFDSAKGQVTGRFSNIFSKKKPKAKVGVEFLFDFALALSPCSYMYRRNFVPPFDPRLKYQSDYLSSVEVFKNGKLGYIDEVLGAYRRHDKNVTKASDFQRAWLEEQLVALAIITARYPELSNLVKARRTQAYITQIGRCLLDGDKNRAKLYSKALFFDGAYLRGVLFLALSNVVSSDVIQRLLESDNKVIHAVVDSII